MNGPQTLVHPSRRGRVPADREPLRLLLIDADRRRAGRTAKLLDDTTESQWFVDWVEAVLDPLNGATFDLVLLTVDQPDGAAVTTLGRLVEAAPDVPSIVLTDFPPRAFAAQVLAVGAQDCLPLGQLDAHTLERAVAHAVERHRIRARYAHELWSASILHADFLSIVRNSADAILVLDEDARVVEFANPAAEDMFGLHADGAVGQPCPFSFTEETSFEIDLAARAGAPRQVDVQIVSTSWRGTDALLALARDVTDRRILEAQLGQAQKLESVGRLAAGIAHEINTPTQFITDNMKYLRRMFDRLEPVLASCQGLVETARSAGAPPDALAAAEEAISAAGLDEVRAEVPDAFDDSLEGLGDIARIVGAMRTFAHPGGSEKTSVDVRAALESTVAIARNEWKDVAEVTIECDPDLPAVPAVLGDINQVFLNLVINASHALEDRDDRGPGHIEIRARHHDDAVEITVTDDGVGIPPDIKDRIFDPFFTTKEVGRGTGQGLAISRTIVVDRHGGSIEAESEPGRGSMFRVRLPLTDEAAAQQAA